MSLLAFVIVVLVGGLLLGALARLAVPGPDPMPLSATVALGIAGSLIGGVVSRVFLSSAGSLPIAFAASVLLLILYRRAVQRRGITGPTASTRPNRGLGLRAPQRLGADNTGEELRKLERLRAGGVISAAEYEARRAELERS
ncbi:MAG: SHOCT domain-containing protein [Actinomycetota bacterium]|nr:SHOCT domain-containing protein [Actinomycetota bacterium]